MKKLIWVLFLTLVVASLLTAGGCIRRDLTENNGPITTQNYDFKDFTGVDVGSAMGLELSYGTEYSVAVTAGKNLFSRLRVEKNGDTVQVRTEGWSFNWWWGHSTPKVVITMPDLQKLYLSGASSGTVTGFDSTNRLSVKVSGASRLDLDIKAGSFTADISGASDVKGNFSCTDSKVDLSGASHFDLTGTGGDIDIHASGASTAALRYFKVNNAGVDFSGASNGSMDISGKMDVTLSGASSLNYYGNPTLGRTEITGASDLHHKN